MKESIPVVAFFTNRRGVQIEMRDFNTNARVGYTLGTLSVLLALLFAGVALALAPLANAQAELAQTGTPKRLKTLTVDCQRGVSRRTCQRLTKQILSLSQGTAWTWVVKDEAIAWAGATFETQGRTELNLRYMDAATIAHELGHVMTGSRNEITADSKGRELCPACYRDPTAAALAKERAIFEGRRGNVP